MSLKNALRDPGFSSIGNILYNDVTVYSQSAGHRHQPRFTELRLQGLPPRIRTPVQVHPSLNEQSDIWHTDHFVMCNWLLLFMEILENR